MHSFPKIITVRNRIGIIYRPNILIENIMRETEV